MEGRGMAQAKTEAKHTPGQGGTLRSTYTPDGQRLLLVEVDAGFAVFTRWQRITRPFARLADCIAAFEVLEFCEGDLHAIYRRSVAVELSRTSASKVLGSAMARVCQVLADVERREAGLRPISCGAKGSVIRWVPAIGKAEGRAA